MTKIDENKADQYDNDVDSQSGGYKSAEDQGVCYWKDFKPDELLTSMLAIFTITLTAIKSKKLFRRPDT